MGRSGLKYASKAAEPLLNLPQHGNLSHSPLAKFTPFSDSPSPEMCCCPLPAASGSFPRLRASPARSPAAGSWSTRKPSGVFAPSDG
jgi:hypothetical protein